MGKRFTQSVADFPKLLSLWSPNNTVSPREVPRRYQALWVCSAGHEFSATGHTVMKAKGDGCGACSGKLVNPGVSDLATVAPAALEMWNYAVNPIHPSQVAATSQRKYWWRCSLDHHWLASPDKAIRGQGCPYCSGRRVLHGFNDAATAFPELLCLLHPDSPVGFHEITRASRKVLPWRCASGHSWEREFYSIAHVGERCPYCSNHRLMEGFNDISTILPAMGKIWSPVNELSPSQVMAYSEMRVKLLCPVSGVEYIDAPRRFLRLGAPCLCATCYKPFNRSAFEDSVLGELHSLFSPNVPILGSLSLIAPYELDIYYPELKLAIECNGIYWHSHAVVQKNHGMSPREYHSMKLARCHAQGVQLLFIWEDDWSERREELISALEQFIQGEEPVHPMFTILEKK